MKLPLISHTFYEGEEDHTKHEPPVPPVTPPSGSGDDDDKPKFSQKDLNKVLAEDRRKHEKRVNDAVKQLEDAMKVKGLTEKERDSLQAKIEEMNNSLLTKEQLAEQAKQKLQREAKEQADKLTKERDEWQRRFASATINRAIQDAANQNGAYDPEQFVDLLSANTRLVEVTDESGSGTGQFVETVKFRDIDKEGKPVTLDLPVPEAIKRMKDMDRYANLFKSGATGGVGGKRETPSQRGGDKGPPVGDSAAYRKWRETQGLRGKTLKKG